MSVIRILLDPFLRKVLSNCLHERMALLRGTHCPAYQIDMSQLLRSVRLALHLVR